MDEYDKLVTKTKSEMEKLDEKIVALANELRTASMDYDESEVRNIKGLLLGVA